MNGASDDEGSQDQISERLILGDRLLEPVVEHFEDFNVGLRDGGDVDRLAGQDRQVTHEATPAVDGEHSRLSLGAFLLDNPDPAVQHDEQAAVAVPREPEIDSVHLNDCCRGAAAMRGNR